MCIRDRYTREFKLEAVRLSMEESKTGATVARELGIHRNLLYRWRKEFFEDETESFPGRGKQKASDEKVLRLQREVERLREDREILKKALEFFSRESK